MPATRARLWIGLLLIVVVAAIGGFFALKRSPFAAPTAAMQGRAFFGLRDVGFGLSGTLVTTPVTDWSFVNKDGQSVQIETRPWFLIPYTVRVAIAATPETANACT
jgi:hypothetical protein